MVSAPITVCIATIPPRAPKLIRALQSVALQIVQPESIVVEYDHGHTGAAATKNRALARVTSEYVAFLDDDDEFRANHLEELYRSALDTGADVTYGWYQVMSGGMDPRPDRWAQPFDGGLLMVDSYIHTGPLARTKLLQEVGGFQYLDEYGQLDDWGAWRSMLCAGATFHHHPVKTYLWHHDGGNTSGRPDRWG